MEREAICNLRTVLWAVKLPLLDLSLAAGMTRRLMSTSACAGLTRSRFNRTVLKPGFSRCAAAKSAREEPWRLAKIWSRCTNGPKDFTDFKVAIKR